VLKITPWRKDSDGNVSRCHYDPNVPPPDGGYWVEYKPVVRKLAYTLYPFAVKVRNEVWHVWSKDAESAARLFYSDMPSSMTKRKDVVVEEVYLNA